MEHWNLLISLKQANKHFPMFTDPNTPCRPQEGLASLSGTHKQAQGSKRAFDPTSLSGRLSKKPRFMGLCPQISLWEAYEVCLSTLTYSVLT